MNTSNRLSGLALATAAAGLFAVAPMGATADEAKVQCMGVNSCKGHSACKTASSSCKGLNSCKGQGFLEITAVECEAQGGKVG